MDAAQRPRAVPACEAGPVGRARFSRRENHSGRLSSRRPPGSASFRFSVPRALRQGARAILAGLLFAGATLGVSATASADVLVSNIGQSRAGTFAALTLGTTAGTSLDGAQGFTTGSNAGGYTLTSIEVRYFWHAAQYYGAGGNRAAFGEHGGRHPDQSVKYRLRKQHLHRARRDHAFGQHDVLGDCGRV